ncbi:sensor histidine kinase [Cellulomonas sp. P22]|uniref:sensor histidine kinase n=1 Tax=Cellulomonas sp. P22 TaxID=3373189 RepID=UPI00379DF942
MSWWERVNRWEAAHRFVIDATLTAAVALVVVPITHEVTSRGQTGMTLVLSVAVVAPLAWRRSHPTASVVSVYLAALLHMLLGYPLLLPADLAVLAALYSVTVHGPRWAHRVAITGALVGSAVVAVASFGSGIAHDMVPALWMTAFAGTIALAVWAFGLVRRQRRLTIDALVDRAHRLEVERDQQSRIATSAERARIAREMHDIVAHSLSVIIAQADGGRYAADADPAAATRALGTISETGRAALADMRRLLGVLRTEDTAPDRTPGLVLPAGATGAPGDGAVGPTAPQPDGGELETLVEQVRASGVRISLVRMGTPRRLPPGAGLTVYRICQESLTNVLKHAGPDPSVTVLVQWKSAAIRLEVSDDGRGAAAESDGLGQGLLGMRERAAMFGGSVTAGPRPGGGFRVRAELPLPPAPDDHQPTHPETLAATPVAAPHDPQERTPMTTRRPA